MEERSLFDIDPSSSELGSCAGLWALMQVPGIGSAKALQIARVSSSWSQLAEDPKLVLDQVGGGRVDPNNLVEMALNPLDPPKTSKDIRLIGYFDSDYPEALREIGSAPAVLWVKGSVPEGLLAAVVGTRHPTEEGIKRVEKIVSVLVAKGYGIISGLAAGVDTVAHESALKNGGKTWAYLGSGVDVPTPKENLGLAEQIVEHGGGLLAEVDPSSEVSRHSLVARDRLQSGTSRFTVIGQSGIPSGTLHTARFTLEQERHLIVVSPPDTERGTDAWAGNEALIDENGCDPEILKASKKLGEVISRKKPVADVVINHSEDLETFLEEHFND